MLRFFTTMLVLLLAFRIDAADETEGKVREAFYQELEVQRQPQFRMQGIEISQQLHYQIVSWFQLYEPDAAGNQSVVQEIRDATLIAADPLSHTVFADALAQLKGRQLKYRVAADGSIFQFTGYVNRQDPVNVAAEDITGMLVSNVIDEDGWKELAQLTLFQPPKDSPGAKPFDQPTRHDWGSLGSWYGDTRFQRGKRRGNLQGFGFVRQLQYLPPGNAANDAKPATALQVRDAKFATERADGQIVFDTRSDRVTTAHEWFSAKGTVTANVLGTDIVIELHERQQMAIRVKAEKFVPRRP
ncbi:hypothetical protein Poly24_50770 [Rosistilla carotiformis]|uniref:Uncharacterized protein n=1 Tax=Rosistilla carotiformis TaxID=2528017 RepID=A0A518K0L4_9BACT|nr:hypothetical protein [Rosistilla carotiformis]QDV71342.1 hypothetical protein Poly24_50770 [Rosistilla carotiformis]